MVVKFFNHMLEKRSDIGYRAKIGPYLEVSVWMGSSGWDGRIWFLFSESLEMAFGRPAAEVFDKPTAEDASRALEQQVLPIVEALVRGIIFGPPSEEPNPPEGPHLNRYEAILAGLDED